MIQLLAVVGLGVACAGWAALRLTRRRRPGPGCGDCDHEDSCPVDRMLR